MNRLTENLLEHAIIGAVHNKGARLPLIKSIAKYTIPSRQQLGYFGTVDEGQAQDLQDRLDRIINRYGLLGLQVSLKNSHGQTWFGASGTVDLSRRTQLTTDHILRIASTTKLFTSVLTLGLVDSGVLSLEDRIERWLPDFPKADQITVGMLLSHTSGIGQPPFTLKVKLRLIASTKVFTLDELVALAADTKPYDEPGNSHQYSNANHHLLGLIIQKVTGHSMPTVLDEVIFAKLGLKKTALLPYHDPPAELVPGWDNIYTPSIRCFKTRPDDVMLASHANTSGGMVSTADELMNFIDGLFAGKLLSADLVSEMSTIEECNEPAFRHTGYGLGLFRIRIGDVSYLGHLGLFIGFQALVLHNIDNATSIAAVGNLSESRIFEVVGEFSDLLAPKRMTDRSR